MQATSKLTLAIAVCRRPSGLFPASNILTLCNYNTLLVITCSWLSGCGLQDFPRLKVGIGRPSGPMPIATYVLQVGACPRTRHAHISHVPTCVLISSTRQARVSGPCPATILPMGHSQSGPRVDVIP